MKITGAYVDDPTERGVIDFAELCVEVDELPGVTIEPSTFGKWTVGKFGPFVKYMCEGEDADAGDFNLRFRDQFPMVADVSLVIEGTAYPGYALPLNRARQLMRKHCPEWRLVLNEHAAEKGGSFLWLPVMVNPTCRILVSGTPCGTAPARFIRVEQVDVPMCKAHVEDHNHKYAERRTARAS